MEDRIWHKAYAPAVPKGLDYEEITLPAAMERTAVKHSGSLALNMMGGKLTYRELNDLVNRLANALADLGLKKGDRVALIMPNMPQMVIATYAVFKLGGVVVMNNPLYTERELTYQISDSGCKFCICMDLLVPRILKIKPNTKLEVVIAAHLRDYMPFPLKQLFPYVKKGLHRPVAPGEGVLDFLALIKKYPPQPVQIQVTFDDLAALLYTGGTTGVSKGVMLTHRNCSCVVQQMKAWFFDAEEGRDSLIAVFPFFHVAGFTAMMNQSMYRGFSLILVPRPEPQTVLDMTRKYRPTFFGCVPTIYVGLLNHPDFAKTDFSFIKGCLSGAAPLALETIRDWEAKVGAVIIEVYGMTESTTLCHANPWRGHTKVGSVGVPIPDTDCKIVDVETGTRELPLRESGEVIIKGPQVAQGYYQKPEETAEAFRDGWFYTGDIGYMDEDGYLYIVDRKKDMIIAGGYNIYPREIDEILYEHPKVQEACSLGVPDPYRGETVKAYVVPKPGETLTPEEVIAFCRERLAAYKAPKSVEFINELPKSAIGKVLRKTLREMEKDKAKKPE
ncbi:MAG: long-chain fatty acid--CoA ligase [Thermodesulfobacteriota bacterium]